MFARNPADDGALGYIEITLLLWILLNLRIKGNLHLLAEGTTLTFG